VRFGVTLREKNRLLQMDRPFLHAAGFEVPRPEHPLPRRFGWMLRDAPLRDVDVLPQFVLHERSSQDGGVGAAVGPQSKPEIPQLVRRLRSGRHVMAVMWIPRLRLSCRWRIVTDVPRGRARRSKRTDPAS
jgi:hypothetical protein